MVNGFSCCPIEHITYQSRNVKGHRTPERERGFDCGLRLNLQKLSSIRVHIISFFPTCNFGSRLKFARRRKDVLSEAD